MREEENVLDQSTAREAIEQDAEGAEAVSTDAHDAEEAAEQQEQQPADPREQAQALEETLRANPSFIEPVREMLAACEADRQEETALLETLQAQLGEAGKLPVEPLSSIVRMLVQHGALTEALEVDGQPYAGTIEDAFDDESITEDSEVLIYEQITEAGRIVLADLDPKKRTYEMFQGHPHLADALLRTLELCDREGGLKTKELEALLDKEGYLYRDQRTNIPHIYPSLYGNLLTDVGAMRWEHAWITTDLGREVERELTRAA